MELHTLVIDNIASIGHAEIDFTAPPLEGEPVFLICGETGAGKSTILDAVCLALYNDAPRLASARTERIMDDAVPSDKRTESDSIAIGDTRQFLRKGTGEGSAVLTFSGSDGQEYKASWSVGRAYGKPEGKLKDVSWTLEWGDNFLSSRKEVRSKIEAVTGMTFNQYCRTTMLAQGEFSRFLKSPENEKADILEKLTRTDIYARIGIRIAQRTKEQKEKFMLQEQKTAGIALLSEEDRTARLMEIESLGRLLEEENRRKKTCEAKLQLIVRKAELEKELSECEEAKAGGEKEFAALSADITVKKVELGEKSAAADMMEKELESLRQYEEMYSSIKAVKTGLIQIMAYTGEKAEKEKKLSETRMLLDRNAEAAGLKAQEIAELEGRKAGLEKSRETLQEKIKAKGKDRLQEELLSAEKTKNVISEAGTSVRALQKERSLLESERKARENLIAGKKNAELDAREKKDASDRAEREYNDAKGLFEKMKESAEDWAKLTRSRLEIGDICPVCGQKVVSLLSDEDFDALLSPVAERYAAAEKKMKDAGKALNEAEVRLRTLDYSLSEAGKRIGDAEKSVRDCIEDAAGKCRILSMSPEENGVIDRLLALWNDADRRSKDLSARLREVALLEKEDERLGMEAKGLETRISKAKEEADKTGIVREKLGLEEAGLAAGIEAAEKSIADMMSNTGKSIRRQGWEEEFASAPDKFIAGLEAEASAWTGRKNELERLRQEIRDDTGILEKSEETRRRIAEMYGTDAASYGTAPAPGIDWKELASRCNSLAVRTGTVMERISRLHDNIREVESGMKDTLGKYDTPELLKAGIEDSEKNIASLNRKAGEIGLMLRQDRENAAKVEEERRKTAEAEKEYREWERLAMLFGDSEGKKFKKIAQSFILSDLIRNANAYLSRLSDRYVLDNQSGSLTITVRDLYQGGAERSVNTLSGGETFLVSLSLALGLSTLSKSTMQVGTFFIDEGFGTLSGDYLDTVMQTLENLHHTGGKKVGIISHVEALRDRIPVKIEVTRQGNGASRIDIVTD